jgi:hypothetical protein
MEEKFDSEIESDHSIIVFPNITDETYTYIFRNIASNCGIVIRSNKGPIACKTSQLTYILLALIIKYYPDLYFAEQIDVHILCDIYKNILQIEKFYKFSVLNNPLPFEYHILTDTNFYSTFNHIDRPNMFIIGLVNTHNDNKREYPFGVINHYFIIIFKNEKYYSISSYGSDFVCVPQTEVELDLNEFKECVDAFNEAPNESRRTKIKTFIEKYWLASGMSVYLQDEDKPRKHTLLLPDEGASQELALYTESQADKYKFYNFYTFVGDLAINLEKIIPKNQQKGGKTQKYKQQKYKQQKQKNKYKRITVRKRKCNKYTYTRKYKKSLRHYR